MLSTNEHLLSSMTETVEIKGSVIHPPVYIHPEATVENSIIGPAVSISAGTIIRNAIIQNSIIGSNSTIENTALKDSLIGNEVIMKGKELVLNLGDSSEIEPD